MTADDTDLIAAFHQVFGVPAYRLERDTSPLAYLDEESLRTSRHTIIAAPARYIRRSDHPTEPWMDDLAVATGDYRETS